MSSLLSVAAGLARSLLHRRAIHALREQDDRALADMGLLRGDVERALSAPIARDPSRILKSLCCHWRSSPRMLARTQVVPGCC